MANKEGARKSGKFIAVCTTPDVCKTPVGNTVVPIPYAITANLSDSVSTSSNVNFCGAPVFILNKSIVTRVTGDEPGTAGGVMSGTNRALVKPIEGSSSVRVNKRKVVRHGDRCEMNNGNTLGKIIYQGGGGSTGGNGNSNPPVKAETPKEVNAAEEIKAIWYKASPWIHGILSVAGFIPGISIVSGAADGAIYGLEGQYTDAGLAFAAMIPGGKVVTTAGKIVKNAAKVEKAAKAGMQAGKKVTKETAEKTERELAEKIAGERARKEAGKKAAESGRAKEGKNGLKVTANKKYYRNKNERRKALRRDAEDPNSRLTKE